MFVKHQICPFFIDHPGASEISDACKPLKKRSRASTDVEMASSQYRDTSDSDSRGLSDPQVGLGNMNLKSKILYFFLHTICIYCMHTSEGKSQNIHSIVLNYTAWFKIYKTKKSPLLTLARCGFYVSTPVIDKVRDIMLFGCSSVCPSHSNEHNISGTTGQNSGNLALTSTWTPGWTD